MNEDQPDLILDISTSKELLKKCDAWDRLKANPDFQLIISEGYLRNEALRSVGLLGNNTIKASGRRPNVIEDLVSISGLENHLLGIERSREAINIALAEAEAYAAEDRLEE